MSKFGYWMHHTSRVYHDTMSFYYPASTCSRRDLERVCIRRNWFGTGHWWVSESENR